MINTKNIKSRKLLRLSPLVILLIYLAIPVSEPHLSFSTVLNDRDGNLLSASIAADGQWRFPLADSIPQKLETCMLMFEDEYFYSHPGINPVSILRALRQNFKAGKVVSGASTITMQVARMLQREERTVIQKILEMGMALRLETHHSKIEILNQYASLAPFGGNVVGINAASWRYFARPPHLLSWAECAALAVLPNQPGAIYPGTGQSTLRRKRDFLLKKLLQKNIIDSLEYRLSVSEPLPGTPFDIPQKAPHLLTTVRETAEGEQILSTIDPFWQQKTTAVVERKHRILQGNGVDNLAALTVDLKTGKVLAYVGNTQDRQAEGFQVDVIQKPRSSGSILKPLLYTAALDDGLILPRTLLSDIPTFFGGYTPKNFSYGYEGVVNANQALSMSLNIPFTYLLKDYGYERFHHDLKQAGITTLNQPPVHYGLTMVLGGAEVKLWDLAQAYFSMYRKLANEDNLKISYSTEPGKLPDFPFEEINIWHAFSAMTELKRPGSDQHWQSFNSSQVMAWKTGTSFGFRDAWALGLNGEVLIAVWVGNADGEGRAGLSGASSAGPILTELIRLAPNNPQWLARLEPFSITKNVCVLSGMLAAPHCTDIVSEPLGQQAEKSGICSYHQLLWLDETETYEVDKSCYPSALSLRKSVFILPSTQGYYYQKTHTGYIGKPSPYPGCEIEKQNVLSINYPVENTRIFIPRELAGQSSQVIIEAAHQNPHAKLYWHLNEQYLGETVNEHKQSLALAKGEYLITIMDDLGNSLSRQFEVISDLPR
ncbi:MAG: penicillin-binding protein 1C [Cyclobacteriaceae bacterium]